MSEFAGGMLAGGVLVTLAGLLWLAITGMIAQERHARIVAEHQRRVDDTVSMLERRQ